MKLDFEIVAVLVHVLQTFGNIPEADVGEHGLEDEKKTVEEYGAQNLETRELEFSRFQGQS